MERSEIQNQANDPNRNRPCIQKPANTKFMKLSNEEARIYLSSGKLPGRASGPKPNKYGAIKTEYKGVKYDSKREAKHAAELDLRIKAGEVKKWEAQYKIDLTSNGKHVCNYFIDFKVWMNDGSIQYHEVKGKETVLWRLKWKMTKAQYPDFDLKLIK